jgi:hypothetical protein
MNPRRRSRARSALAVSVLAVASLGAACGDDGGGGEDPDAAPLDVGGELGSDSSDSAGGPSAAGVPEECAPFLLAVGPADQSEIEHAPHDFPEPPAGSMLCLTSETMDGSTETADYAYEGDVAEVYSHYESTLGPEWNLERVENIGGDVLSGGTDEVGLEVRSVEGGFRLALVAY